MEAALLMLDVFAIAQVLVWAARGRGMAGLLAWRDGRRDAAGLARPPRSD